MHLRGTYCTFVQLSELKVSGVAASGMSAEAASQKKADNIPGPVDSSGHVITLHLMCLDSSKTTSERFHVGTTKQDIMRAGFG